MNLKNGIEQLKKDEKIYPVGIRSNNFPKAYKRLNRANKQASFNVGYQQDVREGQQGAAEPGGVRDWMRKNYPNEFQTKDISPTAKFKDYPVNGYRNDESVVLPGRSLDTTPSEEIANEAERRKINQLIKKGVITNKELKKLRASIHWKKEPEMWERLQKGESADSILKALGGKQ